MPDISLRDFRAWKASWEDYFELSNGPRLTDSHQLALLRTCLSPDMRATLGQTIPARGKLADQLDKIAGHFRRQRNVALHRVRFEQRHQDHGETFDHFYVGLRELAADADLCGTCLNDRLTTRITAGVASEDLRKKLLAINPFPRLEDVVARCRGEESATNTETDLASKPVVNVARRADPPRNTSSGARSGPRKTQPPATKTICRLCGGQPHRTRSDCPAYGTTFTACNWLHHFAEVCESRNNPLLSQSSVNSTQQIASLAARALVASRTRTASKVTVSLHTADSDARHLGHS